MIDLTFKFRLKCLMPANVLVKLWKIEQIPKNTFLTPEEQACEKHFRKTMFRLEGGRFDVKIPFKVPNPSFPGSKEIAIESFNMAKLRMAKQPQLKAAYDGFMR